MPRPIQAVIHLDALRHNLSRCCQQAGTRQVWAVVKANAYGHGIERVLPAFDDADGLALLDLQEAERARAAGWRKPILLLEGCFEPRDWTLVQRLQLTAVVHEQQQLEMLSALPDTVRPPIELYVKFNTGMQRLGFAVERAAQVLKQLQALSQVRVKSLMTHFANADIAAAACESTSTPQITPQVAVAHQLARFAQCAVGWQGELSLANSSALFIQPDVQGNSVRPGIALYGGTPVGGKAAASFGLKAAMTLRSQLIAIQELNTGDCVGYGSRWRAARPTRVGVVACGYADGYPRIAPDGTPVAVQGVVVPLIGRVSMDMITVDLSNVPQAQVGAEVELWGNTVPIDAVAEAAGTVGYELMCALAPRVPVKAEGLHG